MFEQSQSSFKKTINWNKYLPKNLDYLIDPSFQGVNRPSVLLFENKTDREAHAGYFLV